MKRPLLTIETRSEGDAHWYVVKSARNGRILSTSETYTRERDRDRAALKMAEDIQRSGPVEVRPER